jgi:hypothetical protein
LLAQWLLNEFRMERLPDCDDERFPHGEGDCPDQTTLESANSGCLATSRQSRNGTAERPFDESINPWSRPATPFTETDPVAEQLKSLLLAEASRFRQNASVFMAVVVCLNERTELLVHFTQRDGGVHASVRCERGNSEQLDTLWPSLRQALLPRRVHLAPLRGSFPDRSVISSASLTHQHPERRRRKNGVPTRRPSWETWA